MKHQSGFTLLELAVVLVIISLIVGGVIRAVQIVESVKVDRLFNDLDAFKISYYTYYDRTGDYPGNGVDFDRFIDYDAANANDGTFFQDLFSEGFITTDEPVSALVAPGYYYVTYLPVSASTSLTAGTILGSNQACVTLLEKKHAKHLDNELDDGVWNTGTVRTFVDFDAAESHTLCYEI